MAAAGGTVIKLILFAPNFTILVLFLASFYSLKVDAKLVQKMKLLTFQIVLYIYVLCTVNVCSEVSSIREASSFPYFCFINSRRTTC